MYESAYNYYNDSRVRARESGNWFTSLDEKRMMATVAKYRDAMDDIDAISRAERAMGA